jgi:hypothetical protein
MRKLMGVLSRSVKMMENLCWIAGDDPKVPFVEMSKGGRIKKMKKVVG